MKSAPVWKDALTLVSVRLVLAQLGIVAAVGGFVLLWLRLPDASVFEVAGSVLLALIITVAAGVAESRLLLKLAGRPITRGGDIRGTLLLLVSFGLWFAWSASLARLSSHDAMLAGYLNSRLPHQLRHVHTFPHLLLWLRFTWVTLLWVGSGLLATVVYTLIAGGRALAAVLTALRCGSYWLTLLVAATVARLLTGALLTRIALHGLWAELLSLGLRLALAALCNALLACSLLAIVAVCVRRAKAAYPTPAGGPDNSHPRTVDMP